MEKKMEARVNSSSIDGRVMRQIALAILFLFINLTLQAQTAVDDIPDGTVSFITSQSIYVKFRSTAGISIGDTLFIRQGDKLLPALQVNNLSSMSVVCAPIGNTQFFVNDKIAVKEKPKAPSGENLPGETVPTQKTADIKETESPDNIKTDKGAGKTLKSKSGKKSTADNARGLQEPADPGKNLPAIQDISGRISLSSYSNFSNTPGGNSQRMRYTFSLNAKNISNTRLSAETYISFAHKNDQWSEIQDNIYNGLKIYNLAINYEFNRYLKVLFGRKINPRLSNVGAIDGLQIETKFKSLTAGVLAGSRPDYVDYSFNPKLFQYGIYLSHDLVTKKGSMQSTLAFAEQKNNGQTDRRFTYFQHSNNLLKKLFLFGTVEFDLNKYDTVTEKLTSAFDLSNLYLSLRYRVIKQLSLSASYSNRHNIVYFETYKNIIDQLIDNEALQGLSVQATYSPIKYLSVGAKAGYRDRKSDPRPSKNLYGYITYSRIPKVKILATLSATLLETGYISGKIFSVSLSRDLLNGKLNSCLGYRHVSYKYYSSLSTDPQNMAEINLSWLIYKKLSLSLNYEGTFAKSNQYTRLYINLTQRF